MVVLRPMIETKGLKKSFGDKLIFEDGNVTIPPGQIVSIYGPSGCGKSTFAKLLCGVLTPDAGEVLLDGRNVMDINTESYRGFFGYVPQEILLFSGTIQENIAWGNSDATAEDVFNAARDAQALEFIARLNDRFATKVGEKGATLSGGERQRINLARALYRNCKIILSPFLTD